MSQEGSLTQVCYCGFLNVYCTWGSMSCLDIWGFVFIKFGKNLASLSSNASVQLSPLRSPSTHILGYLKLSQSSM